MNISEFYRDIDPTFIMNPTYIQTIQFKICILLVEFFFHSSQIHVHSNLVNNTHYQWRGHGWVWVGSNPPTFKKGTHEIFANLKTFWGGGESGRVGGWGEWGWGEVGVGLREKKHELRQIVLNKQQHLHNAIIAFNFDN